MQAAGPGGGLGRSELLCFSNWLLDTTGFAWDSSSVQVETGSPDWMLDTNLLPTKQDKELHRDNQTQATAGSTTPPPLSCEGTRVAKIR